VMYWHKMEADTTGPSSQKILDRIGISPRGQPVKILKQKGGKKNSTGKADVREKQGQERRSWPSVAGHRPEVGTQESAGCGSTDA